MENTVRRLLLALMLILAIQSVTAQDRRPIDNKHPLWFIHVDVWYHADPQKIIDLIPEDIRPYVCLNLSLSSSYDIEKNVFTMPHYAFQTYKSWGTVCQQNGMWFSCQPSSGGHTHIPDNDMVTFEYFFKQFPNFLGWNFAEQYWGFGENGDKSSGTKNGRWKLFAQLVELSHKYGGFLTVSWCGINRDSPMDMFKLCPAFLQACQKYPDAILFLKKYTSSENIYNTESVSYGAYISGIAKNYGVRYDDCGWNGALMDLLGQNNDCKYPAAAGIGTVMEQTCVNGAAVWDGPELTMQEDFTEVGETTVDGYQRRNWQRLPNMNGIWIDMFRQICNGTMYIPTREEVMEETKVVVINDVDINADWETFFFKAWRDLYDGLYKQTDPMNPDDGQWEHNHIFFKSTGRYRAIPIVHGLYDDMAKKIPVQVVESQHTSRWATLDDKVSEFNKLYPEVSKGDLYVNRYRNQLVTYTPYSYLNEKTTAQATIPLQYNTCETLELHYDKLSSGIVREYADHIDFYLNNFRTDSTELRSDIITVHGATSKPSFVFTKHEVGTTTSDATASATYSDGTYILTVKHCGPVSLTVNCTGNVDRSAVATTAIPLRPTEQPKQPVLYRGPIIIEAEDMDFKEINGYCAEAIFYYPNVRNHSGMGFVDMGTNSNGSLRHFLNLKEGQTGDYHIIMRYTCATKAGNVTINVNGKQQKVNCEQTAVNEWRTVSIDATMKAGKNTLYITNSGELPMYIDQVIYQPADVEPMKYRITILDSKGGTVSADMTEAVEGDTIHLTVNANDYNKLKELRVVNSVFYTAGKTIPFTDQNTISFVMPPDNVTIQPVFVSSQMSFSDALVGYRLNLADTETSLPEGWRCVQEDGIVHEYGKTYVDDGARVLKMFRGYQDAALLWRDNCAEYGRQEEYPLILNEGSYELSFAMAAMEWNPSYKVSIVDLETGNVIASSPILISAPNVYSVDIADISSAERHKLLFDIKTAGRYVISFTFEHNPNDHGRDLLLLECDLKLVTDDLTIDWYHEWDGCTATSQVIEDKCGEIHLNETLEPGNTVYGDPSVLYTHYADLSGYNILAIEGTSGMQLRVLLNRLEVGNGGGDDHGGALIELNSVIGEDGVALVDFSTYDFAHLNAIKVGWGSTGGVIRSMKLVKGKFPAITPKITVDNITREYGDENPELTYQTSSPMIGLPALTTTATKTSPKGEYDIIVEKGTLAGNYTAVNGTLTITKAPLAVKAGTYTKKQGEDNPEFTLTYEGWKNNETEAVLTQKPTATTTATKESAPGEYEIKVSGGEATNYELSYTIGKLIITQADAVTVTAKSYTRVYGDANPKFGYTSEGATLVGEPEITCEAMATSPVGTYPIVIKKGTVTNYNTAFVNGTLTITKAPLTVKVENVTREQYVENPEFVITYTGWKLNDDESILTKKPKATTKATKDSPVGEYEIVVSGGEAKNYVLSYQNGVLTVIESTGIATISATHPANVYNVQGRMVRAKATTLEGLPQGVYIVNGRKIVIR